MEVASYNFGPSGIPERRPYAGRAVCPDSVRPVLWLAIRILGFLAVPGGQIILYLSVMTFLFPVLAFIPDKSFLRVFTLLVIKNEYTTKLFPGDCLQDYARIPIVNQ
jgi:hypothetical protein